MNTIQVGDVVGDYRVIGIAGSGGMGTVYKIEHVITRRIEAMKLLPAGLSTDPDQVHRFEREIQLQARLHHPNIVALYNAVRAGDLIALVMEFVEGDSLQRMVSAGPLPVETAVNFASQVLRALAYAHQSGVIHRDVSPANIIITPDLTAKLSDFGLALGATDLRISTTGVALGSPWYMSPEQVRGLQKLDARTDLYAMGAVLHEMLTGRKLFEAEGSFAVMRAHVEAVPQTPSLLNPRVPPALDAIVSKAVAKDPAMRFQSADEFRLALQRGALAADPLPKPSSPRNTWAVGLPGALPASLPLTLPAGLTPVFPAPPSRLPGILASPRAMLMVLVPTILVAGFCAVRFLPNKRQRPTEIASRTPAASTTAVDRPSPVLAPPPMPEVPPVAAVAPAKAPTAPEVAREDALPRAKLPAKALRQPSQTEQSMALRITGGEPHPVAATPAPKREAALAVEAPDTAPAKPDLAAVPEPAATAAEASPSEPLATSQAGPPAAPQNSGNRLMRALGKVNPFRKSKKTEPGKVPPGRE